MDEPQLDSVRRLLQIAERYHLAELEVEEGGLKVTIRGGQAHLEPHRPAHDLDPAIILPGAVDPEEPQHNYHQVHSPMTGTFYRSPSPEAPTFVEPGDHVEERQTVGLIEAMKVFSEVPSDCSGRVVEVCAKNGQLVQQGDILLLVDVEP